MAINRLPLTYSGAGMITATQCQQLADYFKELSRSPNISKDRASRLRNIARSFAGSATQLDMLAALTRDEAK